MGSCLFLFGLVAGCCGFGGSEHFQEFVFVDDAYAELLCFLEFGSGSLTHDDHIRFAGYAVFDDGA